MAAMGSLESSAMTSSKNAAISSWPALRASRTYWP